MSNINSVCATGRGSCWLPRPGVDPHGHSGESWNLKAMPLMPPCATGSKALRVSRVTSNPLPPWCQNTLAPIPNVARCNILPPEHNLLNNSDSSTIAAFWEVWTATVGERLSPVTEVAQGAKKVSNIRNTHTELVGFLCVEWKIERGPTHETKTEINWLDCNAVVVPTLHVL